MAASISAQEERMNLAFAQMGISESFILAVVGRLPRIVTNDVPTAATNGAWFKFNPEFLSKQDPKQVFGLILHEALHVVFLHMWRREGRHPGVWNYANDALINSYIRQQGYALPDGGVEVPWVTFDMASEDVYRKLMDELPPPPAGGGGKGDDDSDGEQGDGLPRGGFDGTGDLEDADDEAGSDTRRVSMEASIMAAAKMAKECGQGSALIDRILGAIEPPKVRWQDAVHNMLTEAARAQYNYSRPSRRFIGSGLFLPSLHNPKVGPLLIGFDVSGSIDEKMCTHIASEITWLVADTMPEYIEIVYCADSITGTQVFEGDDELRIKPVGTGGTRFKPVFDHAEKTGAQYAGMIYFTDLEGPLDELVEPPFPVVWADFSGSKHKVPFGDYIEVPA